MPQREEATSVYTMLPIEMAIAYSANPLRIDLHDASFRRQARRRGWSTLANHFANLSQPRQQILRHSNLATGNAPVPAGSRLGHESALVGGRAESSADKHVSKRRRFETVSLSYVAPCERGGP